jgi:hypothetical protein
MVNGLRARVYIIAERCRGYYDVSKENSIKYEGNDLKLSIMFESNDNARDFIANLYAMQKSILISNPFLFDRERDVAQVETDMPFNWILSIDYISDDSDSPEYSINVADYKSEVGSEISIGTMSDPETQYLMIENPNNPYLLKLEVYNCHLKSKKDYPDSENDVNNVFKFSWSLHQRFDGLNTFNQHLVPQIAIRFVRKECSELVPITPDYNVMKDKVIIAIESPDLEILNAVHSTLKAGSIMDNSSNSIFTFVHVQNADKFKANLTTKYEETKFIWNRTEALGEPIPPLILEEVKRKRTRSSYK